MAELLGISLRSIQSFEQGWRKIPTNTERQILYLFFMKDIKVGTLRPCWEIENCPLDKREKCSAWEKTGIAYTGLVEFIVNAMVDIKEPFIEWPEF